jgi:hypothetical protein
MNPPAPGVYTVRMRHTLTNTETVWKYAAWNGSAWHLPPYYTFVEWIA